MKWGWNWWRGKQAFKIWLLSRDVEWITEFMSWIWFLQSIFNNFKTGTFCVCVCMVERFLVNIKSFLPPPKKSLIVDHMTASGTVEIMQLKQKGRHSFISAKNVGSYLAVLGCASRLLLSGKLPGNLPPRRDSVVTFRHVISSIWEP